MLDNTYVMLKEAKENKYAVPQFNINNLEWTKIILETCEEYKCPVILGVSEGALKYMGGANAVVGMVTGLTMDLKLTIPVALHLDHGQTVEMCKKVIDAGFTSVMIDASKYGLAENIRITKEVVDYAHLYAVTVEAEVGHVGGVEDGVTNGILNATLEDCIELTEKSGIDSLAPALGSVHGPYVGEPNLDYSMMAKINDAISIPLVLHGGTGIPDDDIRKAISCGTSKININTELQQAWHSGVLEFIEKDKDTYDPRKVIASGSKNMKKSIEDKIKLFLNR